MQHVLPSEVHFIATSGDRKKNRKNIQWESFFIFFIFFIAINLCNSTGHTRR